MVPCTTGLVHAASPAPGCLAGFDPGLAPLSPLLSLSLRSQVVSHLDLVSSPTLRGRRSLCWQEEVLVHATGALQMGNGTPDLGCVLDPFLYIRNIISLY